MNDTNITILTIWTSSGAKVTSWIFNGAFLLGSFYILFVLVAYSRKSKIWNKKSKIIQMTLAFLMLTFTILRLIITFLVIGSVEFVAQHKDKDMACRMIISVSSCWLDLTVLPSFIFLWYRQKILYRQPLLQHLNSSFIKLLSNISLFLIIVKTPAYPTWFLVSKEVYFDEQAGCMVRSHPDTAGWVSSFINAMVFVAVANLCVLFFVPLFEQIHNKKKTYSPARGQMSRSNANLSRSNARLLRFTVSNTISLGVCAGTTLVAILVNKFVFTLAMPPYLRYMTNNAVLFVYLVTLLFLFDRCNSIVIEIYSNSIRRQFSSSSSASQRRKQQLPLPQAERTTTTGNDVISS